MHPIVKQKIEAGHCICAPRGLSVDPRCPIHKNQASNAERARYGMTHPLSVMCGCAKCQAAFKAEADARGVKGTPARRETRPADPSEPEAKIARREGYDEGWNDCLSALGVPEPAPIAWVPIHPRNGPLWSMTTDKPNPERLPSSYPLRPLVFAAGVAIPLKGQPDA